MLSNYQSNLVDEVKDPLGAQCIIVDAKAGSGKTFTLCECYKHMRGNIGFFAFNKAIATELTNRGMPAMTMHSLGMKACNNGAGRQRINNYKPNETLTKLGIEKKLWSLYKKLNSLGRAYLHGEFTPQSKWDELVEHFDLVIEDKDGQFWPDFKRYYSEMFLLTFGVDFDDMVSLPIFNNYQTPKYDWILVDEAQDLNPCRLELIFRASHAKTRFVFVGDPNQAIYGFTGAMCDSMAQIAKKATDSGMSVKTMPLSICYRCSKNVIKEAQSIVNSIEWAPDAVEGAVNKVDVPQMNKVIAQGDVVLCRTIAPLVKTCFGFIRAGKKAMIKGKEIGEDLCNMVDRVCSRSTVHTTDFLAELDAYRAKETEKLSKANRELQAELLNDKCETLIVLAEGADTIHHLKLKIESLFSDSIPANTITCSSVHKSKGLEWATVWIIRPDLLPFPKASRPWQVEQEHNLKYVAITRAKKVLNWVGGE